MIVIADETKLVARLGNFRCRSRSSRSAMARRCSGIAAAAAALGYADLSVLPRLKDGAPVKTDSGNPIYDCAFGAIKDVAALAAALSGVPGVVEHGLFVRIATTLLIAHPGEVEIIQRSR